jgi:23S rRNA (guanosine2251-2'-O)-methyltransferase
MSKQYLYGIHTVSAFLEKYPDKALNLFVAKDRDDDRMQKILALANKMHLSIERVHPNKLDQLTQEGVHQGVVLHANVLEYQEHDLEALLAQLKPKPLLLVLDSIQDPHNLGACLRVADASGVDLVIIPKDRSATLTPLVRKIASGAAEMIPVVQVTNLRRALEIAQKQGIWFVGMTLNSKAISLYKTDLTGPLGLVLGSEGSGLRTLTEKQCDNLAYIPMQGSVESLNVSVAAGIGLFEAVRQRME